MESGPETKCDRALSALGQRVSNASVARLSSCVRRANGECPKLSERTKLSSKISQSERVSARRPPPLWLRASQRAAHALRERAMQLDTRIKKYRTETTLCYSGGRARSSFRPL